MYSRYLKNIPKGPITVMDLGGNTGGFILCLVNEGFTISQAASLEMNPNTFTRLRFNLAYNNLFTVIPVNAAAYSEMGTITVENSKGSPGQSIRDSFASSKGVSVPTLTLDAIVSEHFGNTSEASLDLLKIDIEGAEYDILTSDTSQRLNHFKHLIIEIHPSSKMSPSDLVDLIQDKGFQNLTDPNTPDKDVYYFKNTRSVAH
jgi:FkbM family methyltransferase